MWLLAVAALAQAPAPTLWAGHQVTVAVRRVPLLGAIETRQDVFMLAEVVDRGDALTLVERACHITLVSTAGVTLRFAPAAVRRLPRPTIAFTRASDGVWRAAWRNGWGEADVDGNGQPGFSVGVEARVCSGQLEVASHTQFQATGLRDAAGLRGQVDLQIERDILAASNTCLSLVPRKSRDLVSGAFAYAPAPPGATCEGLDPSAWPVRLP